MPPEERDLKLQPPPTPAARALSLMICVSSLGTLILGGMILTPDKTQAFLAHALTSILLFGKFIVLGGGVPGNPLTAWELAALVIFMDTCTGVLWVYNMDLLFRIPWFGPRFKRAREKTRIMVQGHPWLRRQAFLGVSLVVMFPVTGTGAIMGSILGRFVGVRRLTNLLAILIGSICGTVTLAWLVTSLGRERAREIMNHPFLLAGALLALLSVLMGFSFWRYRRRKRRSLVAAPAGEEHQAV